MASGAHRQRNTIRIAADASSPGPPVLVARRSEGSATRERAAGWPTVSQAADQDQRRVVAQAGCRRVGVVGPVGARERAASLRRIARRRTLSWAPGATVQRLRRAEDSHGTA